MEFNKCGGLDGNDGSERKRRKYDVITVNIRKPKGIASYKDKKFIV